MGFPGLFTFSMALDRVWLLWALRMRSCFADCSRCNNGK